MKILIAEDMPMLQNISSKLMHLWGYDFDIASDGQEAVNLAKTKQCQYDICLMDIDMPVMDGYEATRIIRQTTKYFPIVAVTGNEQIKDIYYDTGMDDFLKKPYNIFELYDKIMIWSNNKILSIVINDKKMEIKKEMPMNHQEASIIKKLKEQGLSIINVFGTSTEATFVVNSLVPEYIEKEFAENQKQVVQFLDHNAEGKGLCRLFAKTSMVVKTIMLDEDFEIKNREEKERLIKISITKDT